MKNWFLRLALCVLASACNTGKNNGPSAGAWNDPRATELHSAYQDALALASEKRDPVTGWLTDDCDAMVWQGKYAGSQGVEGALLELAEYASQPGRFRRRAGASCSTSWSRDMFVAGLLPYAYRTKNVQLLARHIEYGRKHGWVMGEPYRDGRVQYLPGTIGLLFSVSHKLGGPDDATRHVPNVYPAGLDDYQAHLQMNDIWLRGEANGGISDGMLERIVEHSNRETECPFYQFLRDVYTRGNLATTVGLLLKPETFKCEYVRCQPSDPYLCRLAEWIFVADLTLRKIGDLKK